MLVPHMIFKLGFDVTKNTCLRLYFLLMCLSAQIEKYLRYLKSDKFCWYLVNKGQEFSAHFKKPDILLTRLNVHRHPHLGKRPSLCYLPSWCFANYQFIKGSVHMLKCIASPLVHTCTFFSQFTSTCGNLPGTGGSM